MRRIISHVRQSRALRKKRIKPNTTPSWARANCPRSSRPERKPRRSAARSGSARTPWTHTTYCCDFMNVCVSQARDRYEKVLEDVTGFAPRYMEEMESVFDQSQEEERKRISFLKQAFLSIHRHLDITNNERFTPQQAHRSDIVSCLRKHSFTRLEGKQMNMCSCCWFQLFQVQLRICVHELL